MFMNRDFEEAAPQFAEISDKLERRAGPENPLRTRFPAQGGRIATGLGQTRQALSKLEELLPTFEHVYGRSDEQTLKLRQQIGELLIVNGQIEVAWQLLNEVLVDLQNAHSEHHPETNKVRQLLTRLEPLRHQGVWVLARAN